MKMFSNFCLVISKIYKSYSLANTAVVIAVEKWRPPPLHLRQLQQYVIGHDLRTYIVLMNDKLIDR